MSPLTQSAHQVLSILKKDLLIEWRARTRVLSLLCFTAIILLLFSFAVGPDTATLRRHCGGYLWLSLLFCSTAMLSRSLRIEEESGAMDSLLLAPISPIWIFLGKATANAIELFIIGLMTLPICFALCDVAIADSAWRLLVIIALGSAGLAAPGTLFATITERIQGQVLLMPLLLFPLVVPMLLAAVKSTSLILTGDLMDEGGDWLTLLVFFNAMYWPLCGVLFERVVEV